MASSILVPIPLLTQLSLCLKVLVYISLDLYLRIVPFFPSVNTVYHIDTFMGIHILTHISDQHVYAHA